MLNSWDDDEVYRTYISPLVYWCILGCLAYTGFFWLMFFFLFFGATLITSPEDVQEDDLFVDEDETEAYNHTMMEFEMFREYFDDQTGMTLGEWSGVEIMPIDLDELLDSVTEDPLIKVSSSLNCFFIDNYNLLTSMYGINKLKYDFYNIVEYYWQDDYMPHTLYRYTTQRMQYVDYHDIYQKTKDWDKVKREWKEIAEEESQKQYQNSLLMASVLDQGLHGFREYDFYSFHQYDYMEIFNLFNNIGEISYFDDQDEWDEYIESLKHEGEWGRFLMPEPPEKTQHYLEYENDTDKMEELMYHLENGFIPNLAHKDFDDTFFDNHLIWDIPNIDNKYLYTKQIFFCNVNISYINIAYSPVLSILHCKDDDIDKQQALMAYYDGVFTKSF